MTQRRVSCTALRVSCHACPARQALFESFDINVTCDSEEAANYTKTENKMFLIADGDAAQDPKTVHLRCPSPECMVRLCAYDHGVEHFETFENNNPFLAKKIKAATFGSRQCYDIQMQVGAEGSFIASEMLGQVWSYNSQLPAPGEVGGEDARSYLRTSTGNEILEGMRKADVTYYTAEQWENVSLFLAEVGGARLPFGLAVPAFLIESRSISQSRAVMNRTMEVWMEAGVKEAWLVDPIVISYDQLRRRRNGETVLTCDDVPPTFGQVDVYVRNDETGKYTMTTFEKPETVRSVTALPGFKMNFTRIWDKASKYSASTLV